MASAATAAEIPETLSSTETVILMERIVSEFSINGVGELDHLHKPIERLEEPDYNHVEGGQREGESFFQSPSLANENVVEEVKLKKDGQSEATEKIESETELFKDHNEGVGGGGTIDAEEKNKEEAEDKLNLSAVIEEETLMDIKEDSLQPKETEDKSSDADAISEDYGGQNFTLIQDEEQVENRAVEVEAEAAKFEPLEQVSEVTEATKELETLNKDKTEAIREIAFAEDPTIEGGHQLIQEADEENETAGVKETRYEDDSEADKSREVVLEDDASIEKVNHIDDGDKENTDNKAEQPTTALDVEVGVSGGEQGGALEDKKKEEPEEVNDEQGQRVHDDQSLLKVIEDRESLNKENLDTTQTEACTLQKSENEIEVPEETEDKTNLSAVIEEEKEDESIDTNVISEDAGEKQGHPPIQEAEQLTVAVEDAKPEKSKDDEENKTVEDKETTSKGDVEAEESTDVLAEHASIEKENEVNQIGDGDKEIADKEEVSSSAVLQTPNQFQEEETNTAYTEQSEVNSSVEIAEPSVLRDAAEASTPPLPLELIESSSSVVVAESEMAKKVEEEVEPKSYLNEEKETPAIGDSADETVLPASEAFEVPESGVKAKECLEEASYVEVDVNGNTQAEIEEAKPGTQEKESETMEVESSEIEVPEIHIKSEDAEGKDKTEEPEKPMSVGAAKDSICEDISNEGVNDEQGSVESSGEVKYQVVEEIVHAEEIHDEIASIPETEDPATIVEGIIEKDVHAEVQNQEEAEEKLNLSAVIDEVTPMVSQEDSLQPKETEDKLMDADAISEDAGEGQQNFTLIQDEQLESRAVEMEVEVASFEPLEQASEDTEATKEPETLIKDKTEAVREITFAEDPKTEEGHQLIQEADEENETIGVKETQCEDDLEADKSTEVVLEDHASIEKVNQTGDGDQEFTDNKAEQPTAALDVEVEQRGALEYKQKEEHEEVNDELGEQVDGPIHDDQSLLKVIEEQESLSKEETTETTETEACTQQKSEKEIEVAENVSIGVVTQDEGEGLTDTKEDLTVAEEEVERPEIAVAEISSVKVESEEVEGLVLEKTSIVNDDADEEQNQEETEDKPNLSAVIDEETETVSKEDILQSKETEDKSTDANAISEDGGEEQGHSSIQEAEQLTVALEDAKPEKSEDDEENETAEAIETSKYDLEAEESTYVVAENASLEKENEVSQIVDGDKETADKEPSAALDAEGDVSGGEQGGSLEDIQKEEVSSSAELQTPSDYQVEEINTASTEQFAEPSVPSDVAEASTPPLPLELVESSSSVVVAESEIAEAVEEEVESKSYLSEEKETPTVGDSAYEKVLHASEACEVPEFGVKAQECPEEIEFEVNGNTQADNEEAKSETQEKESETKEVVSSEIEVPQIHIKSEDAECKDKIEEPEQQPAASVGEAKESIFDDISNEGVNDEQGSAETSGEFKEEVIEEVGQVEKVHEGSASIPETENHATIVESIIEEAVKVESEETENLELSSAQGVKEVCLEKEEPQRPVDFEVNEKKPEDEALESPVQDCNTYENEPMPNEITTQEEQSASEQVQDVEMQKLGEVNELIHDGNSTEQKVDEYVDEIQVEGGGTKDIHETLAQQEESDCVIVSSEDNETAANENVEIEETITVQEKDASVEVNGQISEEVPSEIEVNMKSEEAIDEHKIEESEKQPESTDAANRSICDIISNEGVSGEQGNAETLIEERDAGLPLVDNTEANDAEETEVNNLESKEPPVGGDESNPMDIERSKMQMQDSYSTAQTEDVGEATKVIIEENASYDNIGSEDTEGEDLGAEVVEVLGEQPTEEPASSESIQESEEVSKEKPILDTQHEEHVSSGGETTSGSDFPSVELADQTDETEPTLATELIEDSATIVEDITKEAVTVEGEETEKHELSSAADNEEMCLEKEEPQQFEATEGAQDIECEVGEVKESEDEIELIQNVITTQEGPEKDASVLFEDVQEETPTTIQEIVEESEKECLVEPPELNGHTETGNEAVATTRTQGKESEITGLTSEDVDDEQKIEEPEKQPKSTDDSICDHISNEGVNDEQASAETSEEAEEQVVEKQNLSEENEIGNTTEIHQTSDEHVTERSRDIEIPVIKEEIPTEEEITVADVKEETPIEEVHIVQGQVEESGNVKLGRDEEAEDEITKAEEKPEEHTSGSDFPSEELGDQIDRTEPTVATEQIEDSATIVGNITEDAVTVESEESEKHELSSATEEVCLEKEEAQQSEAIEGTKDIQCEVGELKESEDGQKEPILNVINTNEGQDESEQVPNAEKQSVSEVNEVVQDEIPAEQKVDEEAAKDDEDTKRNVEGDETIIVQENDASMLCKEDVEEQTSTTIQETVEESEKQCVVEPSEVNDHTETEIEAVATGNQENESETIEDVSSEIEVQEIHKKSEDDDGNKFEEPEKEPKGTDDSICDHISNEEVNDESAETSEAVEEQVFEEVVEKQNISEENELNQKLGGIEKVDECESLKLEDESNREVIDQTLVEHVTERSYESYVADVNEETPIEEVLIVQGEVDESGNVKPERDEEAEKDEITKGDVETEETVVLQKNDATEDGSTVEEVVREIDVIKEDITESEVSDSKNLDLESVEEQQEIVTETDKSIISTEEVHDEDIESGKTLEGCDTKPIYQTSVQQLTSNKEADFEEHGERDSGIPETTSETESSVMKLEETEVTEDEEISCSVEGTDEAVKELISEIPSSESQPDKEIKETEVSSHVTIETKKEETQETETTESITEAEDSETRNLKIQDEAEKQYEIEPILDGNSQAEVDNGQENVESESIRLESGRADETNEEKGGFNEAEENAKASDSSSVELQEVVEEEEQIICSSREIKSELMAEIEPKETVSGSEDSEIKSSNFEEICAADVNKSENVAVVKEETPIVEEVHIVDDEANLICETSSQNLAVSEDIASVSVEGNDETKEAATTSESSTMKEAGDQSSAEMVTLIERENESPEAHIDNSTETGIASCVTRELIREGDDETEEAATKSESSTALLHKEEDMSSILQEKDAEEHVEEVTAEEAHSIKSVTPLEEETRTLTSEGNHESFDSEAKNLNLEEATILDVTEADEKEITYEEEKGIVSGECIEAEDTSVRITEGGVENETREAEIASTVTIESTELTSEVEPEVKKEEPESEPENSGLQNLNLEEVTTVDDVKLSSVEAEEYSREGDDETKEIVSLTFEAREIISEAEPEAENKPSSESAGSEINSLNLEEVTAADAKQSDHVIDANEEVHETADMIKEATKETEVDSKKPCEKVRGASEATEGIRFTEEEEKYENEAAKQSIEKDVDAAKENYETIITEERESSTAFPSTVQSEDIESYKEVAEETDSSYDKSLGVEVVDEAEAKLNEVASEKGSELISKEEADKEGGLQDYAPKDAVISEGGPQILFEDRKITPEVKSEVQSRDIFTGPEFVEGETKPAPENIDVHPKEVEDNHETIDEAETLTTGVAVDRNIDTSYVMIGAEVTDTKSQVIDETSLDATTDKADSSLSDLLHKARDQNQKVITPLTEERDMVGTTLELHNEEADAHEAKTDEERDEAEVMVESSKDIDVKTPKKHSNILSGVSSKVKHSISKVKKAITGKSSNSKTKVSKMNEALPAS